MKILLSEGGILNSNHASREAYSEGMIIHSISLCQRVNDVKREQLELTL